MFRAATFLLVLAASIHSAHAQSDRYRIQVDPYGSSSNNRSSEIEMRQRLNPDPTTRYRGTLDSDGSVRMRNLEGSTLRGTIDNDGYGRLRDEDGNQYRVKPR